MPCEESGMDVVLTMHASESDASLLATAELASHGVICPAHSHRKSCHWPHLIRWPTTTQVRGTTEGAPFSGRL